MTTFDPYALDNLDYDDDGKAISAYSKAAMAAFAESSSGAAYIEQAKSYGFWIDRLIDYGYIYADATLPQMTKGDMQQLMMHIFPRKLTLVSMDDADEGVDELIAFWEFLRQEYRLPGADSILDYLGNLDRSEFKEAMFDPAKAGMAKSFLLMGQQAGFDMSAQEGIDSFMSFYNASIVAGEPGAFPQFPDRVDARVKREERSRRAQKKARRKMSRTSRKKSRAHKKR